MTAGGINIEIHWNGACITDVVRANTRPAAFRLLIGRTPAEARAMVPRLFTLCRHGQTQAACLALAAAEGDSIADNPGAAVALAAEAAQEHLWRLLLDWPELLNRPPARDAFVVWHRRLLEAARLGEWGQCGKEFADFVGREILGQPPSEWLDHDRPWTTGGTLAAVANALRDWDETPAETALLPDGLPAAAFYRELAPELLAEFAQYPRWRNRPAETGPLARWHDAKPIAAALEAGFPRLAARVLARGVDLARCALEAGGGTEARRRAEACGPAPGIGFACVETSRGLLMHRVRLSEGRVADYLIVAPTEWNFHPEGALRSELIGLPAPDAGAAERRARLLALALDPCVSYNVRVKPENGSVNSIQHDDTSWNNSPTTGSR